MSDVNKTGRASKPFLRPGAIRSGSYIQDHNDYARTIDESLDGPKIGSSAPGPGKPEAFPAAAVPPSTSPARIKDSGIIHNMTHNHCAPLEDDPPKIVATIFYKASAPRQPTLHADNIADPHVSSPPVRASSPLPAPTISEMAAPTMDLDQYPLEPPPPDFEPLDHLYGPYITQVCLTHFLHTLHSIQNPYQRITSSHRCLDDQRRPRVVEVTFSPPPSEEYISFSELRKHELLWRFEREWNVEVILQRESIFRRLPPRLAVFDMDSTLIEQEVIDELAATIGVGEQVAAITARAMAGELDFEASLRARVALLKGVSAGVWEELKPKLTLAPGAEMLLRALRRMGTRTALLSGGFVPLARYIGNHLRIDVVHANELAVAADGSQLTGELVEGVPIVDAKRKRDLLLQLRAECEASEEQVMAVGDGANDLLMLGAAGLGVAFKAKPKVQLEAPCRLNADSLLDLLYLTGLTASDIAELAK